MKRTLNITVEVNVTKDDMYAAITEGVDRAMREAGSFLTKYKRNYGGKTLVNTSYGGEVLPGVVAYDWSVGK